MEYERERGKKNGLAYLLKEEKGSFVVQRGKLAVWGNSCYPNRK
jgi:hypothetical protein